jgi:ketosteroid isomerase-like protein
MTSTTATVSRTQEVVTRYYGIVGDLASTEADLREVLDPAVRIVEHPNPITPSGAVRDLDSTIKGFLGGKSLLAEQSFDLHEVLVAGDRATVRASWRGTVGLDVGPFRKGAELAAEIAAFITVRDGRIADHETFDCYRPF